MYIYNIAGVVNNYKYNIVVVFVVIYVV